jgi:hypothetical protein
MSDTTETTSNRMIIIRNNDVEIARLAVQNVLLLPDGREGAQWRGAVFPIRTGDRIEETDVAFPPSKCSAQATPQASWRLAEAAEVGAAYLFVDGSARDRDRSITRLTAAGITVERSGPNLSDDPGDWFLRLSSLPPNAQAAIEGGLGANRHAALAVNTQSLREQLLSDALRQSLARQQVLAGQLAQAAGALADNAAAAPLVAAELTVLQAALAEAQHDAEALRRQQPAVQPARAAGRLQNELRTAAQELLPRIDLLRDSMAFMAIEMMDRRATWRALAELERETRQIPNGWKVLNASSWWERHVSNGQDNQGRIYARRSGEPPRWKVLVSHKQNQDRDIRNLDGYI